jgi:uncharacterized membrane protein
MAPAAPAVEDHTQAAPGADAGSGQHAPGSMRMAAGEEGDLQKLLLHMEGLQNQNTEMVEVLESLAAAKKTELDQILNDKIMPWIKQLNIPDELRDKVIDGIKGACLKPADRKNYRKMLDLNTNPVIEVMCAAAQAHGEAIRKVEETRQQLHDASSTAERISREKLQLDSRLDSASDLLTKSRPGGAHAGDKRSIDEVDQNQEVNSQCWSNLFESFA